MCRNASPRRAPMTDDRVIGNRLFTHSILEETLVRPSDRWGATVPLSGTTDQRSCARADHSRPTPRAPVAEHLRDARRALRTADRNGRAAARRTPAERARPRSVDVGLARLAARGDGRAREQAPHRAHTGPRHDRRRGVGRRDGAARARSRLAVSYTHLTLPTIYSV